jgi:membrane associated rhomboid family serine protease
MGIYDREYYRDDPPGGFGLMGGVAPACKRLIIINVVVYLVQVVTRGSNPMADVGITRWLDLDPVSFFQSFQVWRIVTYAFCHATETPWHIFFNMLFLWWFGHPLEAMYGSKEFTRFYLAAAVISGACHLALGLAIGQLSPAIGASGAVMAVTMVYAMYYPRQVIYIMFLIPVELRWIVLFYVIVDLHPVLLALGGVDSRDGVAHAAHLGGLLYGFLYKRHDLRFSELFKGWERSARPGAVKRMFRRRPANVQLYEPPTEAERDTNLDRRVDEILAKISAEGEASLTDEERTLLKEASRRYKQK